MKKFYTLSFFLCSLCILLLRPDGLAQTTILLEDFEDSTLEYVPTPADELGDIAASDYYGRIDGSVTLPGTVMYTNPQGMGFYGAQDTDGTPAGNNDQIVLDFTGINISNYTMLQLSLYVAEDDSSDGNEDWDGNGSLLVEVQIDGGGYMPIFSVRSEIGTDGNQTNEIPREDTDFDGVGDGTEITSAFTQFMKSITGTGSLLDIRVTILLLDSGDEDIAIDNIELIGILDNCPNPPVVTYTAPADLCVNAGVLTGLGGGSPAQGSAAGDMGVYSGPGVTDDGNGMTYSFDPAVAGVGIHTLSYTYDDGTQGGCSTTATDEVEVYAQPMPTLSDLGSYCEQDGPQTGLGDGMPTGGEYAGPGVTDDGNGTSFTFDPAAAGMGTHVISYSLSDANNCMGQTTASVTVAENPAAPMVDDITTCTGSTEIIPPPLNPGPAVIWQEIFDEDGVGAAGPCAGSDPSSCSQNTTPSNGQWTLTGDFSGLTASSDFVQTSGGALEAQDTDTEICFLSEEISLCGYESIDFSVTISEGGDIEMNDYVDVTLIVDGVPTLIEDFLGTPGTGHTLVGDIPDDNDFQNITVTESGISGSTLQIEICVVNNAGSEDFTIDDVMVSGTANGMVYLFYDADPASGSANLLAGPVSSYDPMTTEMTSPDTVWVTQCGSPCESMADPVIVTVECTSCMISEILSGTQSQCDPQTNTYTQELTISYTDAPASGQLDVNGQSFPIQTSPQTVTLTGLPADGMAVDVTAFFMDDSACTLTESALFTAPRSCAVTCMLDVDCSNVTDSTLVCSGDLPPPDTNLIIVNMACGTADITSTTFYPANAGCPNDPLIITRTYTVQDQQGFVVTCTQTFTVIDTVPPMPDSAPMAIADIACGDPFPAPEMISFSNNCGENPSAVMIDTMVTGDPCAGSTVTYTYMATDNCGNVGSAQVSFEILPDTDPPVFNEPLPMDTMIDCAAQIPPAEILTASDCNEGGSSLLMINEIHYDNSGSDVGEFIEIAGTAGIDLSLYTLYAYEGFDGQFDAMFPLSGIIPDDGSGFGALIFTRTELPNGFFENGSAEGIALVETATGTVVEFISYEGTVTAVDGPAAGLSSMDIGVSEGSGANVGESLQRTGSGSVPSDFNWVGPLAESPGALNAGQMIMSSTGIVVMYLESRRMGICAAQDTIVRNWSATDACGNRVEYTQMIFIQDTVAPSFIGPADITIDCDVNPDNLMETGNITDAMDACSATMVSYIDTEDLSGCGGYTGTITRTWTVTDECMNSSSFIQTITIQDTVPPSFTVPADITIGCDEDPEDLSLTGAVTDAMDNCTGVIMEEVWFNEFHYDNTGTDIGEFIELAGTAGADLTTYEIYLYNGANGLVYSNFGLFGVIPDESNGFGSASFALAGIQNGAPDGMALIKNGSELISFISYEGSFTATDGPAMGMMSMDVSVAEIGSAAGTSLQLTGTGSSASDFMWVGPLAESPGSLNTDQNMVALPEPDTVTTDYMDEIVSTGCSRSAVIERTWTVTDACDNMSSQIQTITVGDDGAPEALCMDITVEVDENGEALITPDLIDAGSNDACSELSYTVDPSVLSCMDGPTAVVVLTVTDGCGNSSSCESTVTLLDVTAPVIDCPSDQTIQLIAGECSTYYFYNVEATDNCDDNVVPTLVSGLPSGSEIPIGDTTFTWEAIDAAGNRSECSWTLTVLGFPDSTEYALVCNGDANISVDVNCLAEFTPDMILEGGPYRCYETYEICIEGRGCGLGSLPVLPGDIGTTLTVTVRDPLNGNSCWSEVTLEDKFIPPLACGIDTILCTDPDSPLDVGLPVADSFSIIVVSIGNQSIVVDGYDACGLTTFSWWDERDVLGCDTDFTRVVYRHYTAEDEHGNTVSCTDTLYKLRPSLADIILPADYDGVDDGDPQGYEQALRCQDVCNAPGADPLRDWVALADGHPSPDGNGACLGTGRPGGTECGTISAVYSDRHIDVCGGTFKVIRSWTIVDWCTGEILNHDQLIKVEDDTPPEIVCPNEQREYVDSHQCLATFSLDQPTISDDCGDPQDVILTPKVTDVDGNKLDVVLNGPSNWIVVDAPIGEYIVSWTADACGLLASCQYRLYVEDNLPPTAVCELFRQVALSNDGIGKVTAESMDDGSNDNCGPVWFKVLRMDDENVDNTPHGSRRPVSQRNQFACDGLNGDDFVPAVNRFWEVWYDDYVKFCCEDIDPIGIDDVMVIFRVYDKDPGVGPVLPSRHQLGGDLYGHYNDCMVSVDVVDKLPPIIQCPPPATISCEEDIDIHDLSRFGSPIVYDNCGFTLDSTKSIDAECGNGAIIRSWTATDAQGLTASCTQIIQIVDPTPFFICDTESRGFPVNNRVLPGGTPEVCVTGGHTTLDCIEWPNDLEFFECAADLTPEALKTSLPPGRRLDAMPQVPGSCELCAQIAMDYEDQVLDVVEDACFKVLRTWTVIDWCQFDAVTRDPDDPDRFLGYWQYIQILKVQDQIAPILYDYEAENDCLNTDENCNTFTEISISVTDSCNTEADIDVRWTIDLFQDGVFELSGNGQELGLYLPAGDHLIRFFAEDLCGNESKEEYVFTVDTECKAPTPYCDNGIATVIMPSTGCLTVWARDLDEGSFDNCTAQEDLRFTIRKLDENDNPVGTRMDRLELCCEDIPNGRSVICGVEICVIDEADNIDCCLTYINLQDTPDEDHPEGVCEDCTPSLIALDVSSDCVDFNTSSCNVKTVWSAAISDDCPVSEVLSVRYELDISADGSVDLSGLGMNGSTTLPSGSHSVTFILEDEDGDELNRMTRDFTVDPACPALALNCSTVPFSIELDEEGMASVSAAELLGDALPACYMGDTEVELRRASDTVFSEILRLDCADIETGQVTVELCVDGPGGERDCCERTVEITDPTGVCLPPLCETIYAITTNADLYSINTSTGAFSLISNTGLNISTNALGVNDDLGLAYFASDLTIYAVDIETTNLFTVGTLGSLPGTLSNGGASYLDGHLYLGPENLGNGDLIDIYRVELAADGLSFVGAPVNLTNAQVPRSQNFGDFVVEDATIDEETIVISAWESSTGLNFIGRYDVAAQSYTVLHSYPNGSTEQITRDNQGQWWIYNNATGELSIYDLINNTRSNTVDVFGFTVADLGRAYCVDGTTLRALAYGFMKTQHGDPVVGHAVHQLEAPDQLDDALRYARSTADGRYAFGRIDRANYLSPYKNDDTANGLSALDLIRIQQHILQIAPLENPYDMIAADVDQSHSINVLDILSLQEVILGLRSEFSNNDSWRYVAMDESLSMSDPYDFTSPVDMHTTSHRRDFIAVKIGDVNGSASPDGGSYDITPRHAIIWNYTEPRLDAESNRWIVDIVTAEDLDISGFQLGVEGVVDGVISGDIDVPETQWATAQETRIVWYRGEGAHLSAGTKLFSLLYDEQPDDLVLASHFASRIYDDQLAEYSVSLRAAAQSESLAALELYGAQPNPWTATTQIRFYSPIEGIAYLEVYTSEGRQILVREIPAVIGENGITIHDHELQARGLLYYRLRLGEDVVTHSMIKE